MTLDITAADGYDHLFPYVLIVMTITAGVCHLHGPLVAGPARVKIFNQNFMDQFQKEYEEVTGKPKIPKGGLPDAGQGYYA